MITSTLTECKYYLACLMSIVCRHILLFLLVVSTKRNWFNSNATFLFHATASKLIMVLCRRHHCYGGLRDEPCDGAS